MDMEMNTYPISRSATGETTAFEVENVYIGPSQVAKLLAKIRGVSEIEVRGLFSGEPSDILVRFRYLEQDYVLLEPFGDNSRYCICPENASEASVDIRDIELEFQSYKPSTIRRWIGDILSLKFLTGSNHRS